MLIRRALPKRTERQTGTSWRKNESFSFSYTAIRRQRTDPCFPNRVLRMVEKKNRGVLRANGRVYGRTVSSDVPSRPMVDGPSSPSSPRKRKRALARRSTSPSCRRQRHSIATYHRSAPVAARPMESGCASFAFVRMPWSKSYSSLKMVATSLLILPAMAAWSSSLRSPYLSLKHLSHAAFDRNRP
jgi:hypothetical protein